MVQGFLRAIKSLSEHRGSQPSWIGGALATLLKDESLPRGRPLSGAPGAVPRPGAVEAMSLSAEPNEARLADVLRELEAARLAAASEQLKRQVLVDQLDQAEGSVSTLLGEATALLDRVQGLEDELVVQRSALVQADAEFAACQTAHRAELTEVRAKFEAQALLSTAANGLLLAELQQELKAARLAAASARQKFVVELDNVKSERDMLFDQVVTADDSVLALVGEARAHLARVQELEEELVVQRSATAGVPWSAATSLELERSEPRAGGD